jgi:pyridoxal phosphate enzyme (YggS family)
MQSIYKLKERIAAAAIRSGRKSEDITLVAVTKTQPAEIINRLVDYGISDIGESRVQELLLKYDDLSPRLRRHMIGHLQTNKVKSIVGKVCMIQSVDSLHLAEEIDKRCKATDQTMDILLQVNVAGEKQKSGVSPEELPALCEAVSGLANLNLRGLMQIAPQDAPERELRYFFAEAKRLYDKISGVDILSMGMSGDFEIAIEEGANMVRIGSIIFGERN